MKMKKKIFIMIQQIKPIIELQNPLFLLEIHQQVEFIK
jgi:hypothetical protein